MPRGQTGPMLCIAAEGQADPINTVAISDNGSSDQSTKDRRGKEEQYNGNGDVNPSSKGSGKGKKGSNGYGECWHCGEWGHPRRECPHLNDPAKTKASIGVLKGSKYNGGKTKGWFGKNNKGKGKGKCKWGKGYNYNNSYRSPGKGVGKGFNEFNDDWYNAWGDESLNDYNYHYGDDYGGNHGGSLGNVTMMLERGTDDKTNENKIKEQINFTGEHDPLLNTRRARPTTTHNRYYC